MISIRIMTYNINRCRGSDSICRPLRIQNAIAENAPDIVALQDVDIDQDQLKFLADGLGMQSYGTSGSSANGFLSYYPLTGMQEFDLGHGGRCQKADLEKDGRRIHLFNVRLQGKGAQRRQQIASLLGADLLSSRMVHCPALIVGDFADRWWGAGNLSLKFMLQKIRRPLWRGTYPARFPLFGCDRSYVQGDLRVLDADIILSGLCRQASTHLPLILTVQVTDPRIYLHSKEPIQAAGRLETAPG